MRGRAAGRYEPPQGEGYEVGVIRFDFDDAGLGNGTMAAAAKLKPGGATGVEVDDYSAQPVKIRVIKTYS